MARSMDDEDLDKNHVESDDYYAWLGLSKSASKEEINNSYRNLSRIYHPDKHATDSVTQEKAQNVFTKIKKAHEILSDPHKRAIYDTVGIKGLETEGWQIISRTKTPKEIIEEYEKLVAEREERRLNQQTNPKGTISVGINATEIFESYDTEERSIEFGEMAISQSVECPLTTTDTVVIGGSLSTHNGKGQGSVSTVLRRVLSFRSWTEIEIIAGSGSSATVRYFRTFWSKGFMNLSGTFHVTRRGLRPGLSCVLGYQLRHNLMGRITWGAGINSFMNSTLVWENSRNALVGSVQLGLMASFVSLSYVRKFVEKEAKVRGAVKLGTFGIIVEYGCEKKVTQFSSVGASMAVGNTIGILLKIKLIRGNQTFLVPIHLAETPLVPSALIYGTFLPVVAYEVVKKLIVLPFMNDYKAKLLQAKKDANLKRMAEKKKEAEAAIDLMKESVDRCFEVEQARGGLVIKKALFGKLQGENVNDSECIDVSRPLQALVKDSRLFIPQGTELSQLPGFYDPCIGEVSELSIIYEFRRQRHVARFKQSDKILLPSRDHLNEDGYQKLPNERTESNS